MAFSDHLDELTGGLVGLDHTESFSTEEQLYHTVDHLVSSDIRTIVAFVEAQDAVKMICKASKAGLTSSAHVWVLPAFTDPDWWRKLQSLSNCSENELKTALESTLFVAPTKYPPFKQEDQVRLPYISLSATCTCV